MKKIIYSFIALAMAVMTLSSCEDVPAPYNTDYNGSTPTTPVEVDPAGDGTLASPYNIARALDLIDKGTYTSDNVYVKGIVSGTPSIDTSYGNATYYLVDATGNTDRLEVYRGYYYDGNKFTATDQIKEGDTIVVYGTLTNYNGTKEITSKSSIVSINGQTSGGGNTPTPDEPKGDGSQANPYNAAAANKAAAALSDGVKIENVYVSGIVSKIGEISTSYGNATYYLSGDGTTSGEQFEVYRGLYTNGAKFTSEDQLKVGQKVTVLGTLVNFKGDTPEMAQGSKIVSIEGSGSTPETPETPGTSEGITISGTTVKLTNKAYTAGTTTATLDLSTLSFSNGEAVTTITLSDGSTVTFDANGETNGPKYYTATKGVRVYKNNIVTIEGKANIASIVFECDRYNNIDQVGNSTATITFSGKKAVYTNVLKDATGGGVQLRIQKIIVTYAK